MKVELLTKGKKNRNRLLNLCLVLFFLSVMLRSAIELLFQVLIFEDILLGCSFILLLIILVLIIIGVFEKSYYHICTDEDLLIINSINELGHITKIDDIKPTGNFINDLEVKRKSAYLMLTESKLQITVKHNKSSFLDIPIQDILESMV